MSTDFEVHGSRKEHGLLHCQPLWSHVLVPLLCSKFLIKSAPGQEKPLSGSIADVLAAGSQRKQKHKTACCGSSLLCFIRSNTRACFALLQESRSGWFGAPPWRARKYLMGAHILNILFLGAFEKLQKRLLVSSYFSERPGVRLVQLDSQWRDFSRNWCSSGFRKIYRANSSFNKIWHEQRVLYMNTYVQFRSYRPKFSLWWEMLQTKVVEKVKTHFMFNIFFRTPCPL